SDVASSLPSPFTGGHYHRAGSGGQGSFVYPSEAQQERDFWEEDDLSQPRLESLMQDRTTGGWSRASATRMLVDNKELLERYACYTCAVKENFDEKVLCGVPTGADEQAGDHHHTH
ncbi:unnamed protein product, partial [Amoebophrya sp. A120]